MILLTEAFSVVVAQSWRISGVIFAWTVLQPMLRGRIPQQILFVGWIIMALSLLIPVSLPVAWSPFNFARPAHWVPTADLGGDGRPVLRRSMVDATDPIAPATVGTLSVHHSTGAWTSGKILTIIWLAGIGGLLGVRLLARARFYRRLHQSPAKTSLRISTAVAECAEILRIRHPISVQVTDVAEGPALGGLWKPVVLVPFRLGEELTTDELRLVLLHELGHWRRGDPLANLLIQGALILHWFNPFVWFAARVARADCELACDEFVMRRISSAGTCAYGATLLKVLEMVRGQRPTAAVLGILENKQLLKRRIQMIANYRTWTTRRALAGWVSLALLAIVAATREMRAQPEPAPAPLATAPSGTAAAPDTGAYYADANSRFKHGKELAKNGQYAEALAEYLWCYDDGMRRDAAMGGVRSSFLLDSIVKLGQKYPPALQALRDRVNTAKAWLKTHPGDFAATADFGALNRALGNDSATLAYYDQLPADDHGRMSLGHYVFAQLLEAKRYQDAVAAVPYDRFLMTFNLELNHMRTSKQAQGNPLLGATMQVGLLQSGSKQLEALAGAGKLDQAHDLIKVLLEIDHSEATLAILRTHLERAGHAGLLPKPPEPSTN